MSNSISDIPKKAMNKTDRDQFEEVIRLIDEIRTVSDEHEISNDKELFCMVMNMLQILATQVDELSHRVDELSERN